MAKVVKTFVDAYVNGEIFDPDEEIDAWVEEWHKDDISPYIQLHNWLGFTKDEYAQFVENPSSLKSILITKL